MDRLGGLVGVQRNHNPRIHCRGIIRHSRCNQDTVLATDGVRPILGASARDERDRDLVSVDSGADWNEVHHASRGLVLAVLIDDLKANNGVFLGVRLGDVTLDTHRDLLTVGRGQDIGHNRHKIDTRGLNDPIFELTDDRAKGLHCRFVHGENRDG